MIILDSNVWVSYLDDADSKHQAAKDIFAFLPDKFLATEYIILEVATIISQKKDKETANNFIKYISDNRDVEVVASSKNFLDEVVSFYLKRDDRQLSFVDYSLLFLSQRFKIVTFDKKLQNAIKKLN